MHRPAIQPTVAIAHLKDKNRDRTYWKTQSYAARLAALEEIRREYHSWKYGSEPRLQRVWTAIDMKGDKR